MSNYDNWKTTPDVAPAREWAQGQLDSMTYNEILIRLDEAGIVWDRQPMAEEARNELFEILLDDYYQQWGD